MGQLLLQLRSQNRKVLKKVSEPVDIELTEEEVIERIKSGAQERLGMPAEEMVRQFLDGSLEEPGRVIDLLSLAGMLDTDHPLYVKP